MLENCLQNLFFSQNVSFFANYYIDFTYGTPKHLSDNDEVLARGVEQCR